MTKCNNCGKDVFKDKITLHRMNPKGEIPAIWWCEECCEENGVPIDNEIKNITNIIREHNNENKC